LVSDGYENIYTPKILSIFLFLCLGFHLSAQEICDNGIDDDSDGFVDCLDSDADVDQYENWIAFISGNSPQLRTIDLDQFPLQMAFEDLTNLSGVSIPNTADITYNPIQEKFLWDE
jgi:hypothetical protein